jgi:hypothetical protein
MYINLLEVSSRQSLSGLYSVLKVWLEAEHKLDTLAPKEMLRILNSKHNTRGRSIMKSTWRLIHKGSGTNFDTNPYLISNVSCTVKVTYKFGIFWTQLTLE